MLKILLIVFLSVSFSFAAKKEALKDKITLFTLGQTYASGHGVTKDYKKAAKWFEKSAKLGYHEAQYRFGLYLYNGTGVKKNYESAAMWFKRAAQQDNASAQHKLGVLYYNGRGVQQNYKESAAWIKKSIENGNQESKKTWDAYKLWKYE